MNAEALKCRPDVSEGASATRVNYLHSKHCAGVGTGRAEALMSVAESLPAKATECLARTRRSGLPSTPIRYPG